MIPRTLVGNSSEVDRSAIDAASSSMKSGFPSAISATFDGTAHNGSCGEELLGELLARLVAERIELERRIRRETSSPGRPLAEELRPRERHEQDRHVAHA